MTPMEHSPPHTHRDRPSATPRDSAAATIFRNICYMVRVERLIAAGPDRVWDLVGELRGWARMLPTVTRVQQLTAAEPLGVGARFEVAQPGLPRAVYEITDWRPGSGFTWVSSAPGVRTTATHELRTEDDGQTRLTLGIAWSGPLAGLVRPLLGKKAQRMIEQEADTFARLAESDDGGNGDRDDTGAA